MGSGVCMYRSNSSPIRTFINPATRSSETQHCVCGLSGGASVHITQVNTSDFLPWEKRGCWGWRWLVQRAQKQPGQLPVYSYLRNYPYVANVDKLNMADWPLKKKDNSQLPLQQLEVLRPEM